MLLTQLYDTVAKANSGSRDAWSLLLLSLICTTLSQNYWLHIQSSGQTAIGMA